MGGLLMIIGTVIGVEGGAQIVEALKRLGEVDDVIGWAYVAILLVIGSFTAIESVRAIRMVGTDSVSANDAVGFVGLARRVHGIRVPPMISLPTSGIRSISL